MNLRYSVVSKATSSSISPNFTSRLNGHALTYRFHYWGFEGLQRWIHSSFASEDDFSDLGPPVIQGVNTRLKLATEKREFFMQSKDDSRNSTASKPDMRIIPSANSTASKPDMRIIPSARDLLMSLDKSSHTPAKIEKSENTRPKTEKAENTRPKTEKAENARPKTEKPENARSIVEKLKGTCPKTEKPENFSKITSNNKCHSNIKNSSSISIENVPSAVNMPKLLESLSTFGKISSSSMENVASGLDRCVVKYENEESSSRAISAGNITIGTFNLPIRPLHVPKSVTIRIKDIGNDTAYTAVHSICKTIGELVGMVKATENSVDALFSLKDYSETQNILAELNDKIVDDCKWSAHLLANTSSPEVVSKNERIQLGLQVSNRLNMLKNEISARKVCFQDLEYMHLAIMHLEEQHGSGSITN